MKYQMTTVVACLAASSFSLGEIFVNEYLSFDGFVDSSYTQTRNERNGAKSRDERVQLDQIEVDWFYLRDAVSGRIDLSYSDDSSRGGLAGDAELEQAFASYDFDLGRIASAGRYQSMLGFEAFEPTGLYQYSLAYDLDTLLPGYTHGVKYTQSTQTTFFGVSVQDSSATDRLGRGIGNGGFGFEAAASLSLDGGIALHLGTAYEDGDHVGASYIINSYATFELGVWIFAAELNYGEADDIAASDLAADELFNLPSGTSDYQVLSGLLTANFAYNGRASVTGRVSFIDGEYGSSDFELTKYTAAHNYALNENLVVVAELSFADGEFGSQDLEQSVVAVELLFTF